MAINNTYHPKLSSTTFILFHQLRDEARSRLTLKVSGQSTELALPSGRHSDQATLLCCALFVCKILWIILYWLEIESKDFVYMGKSMFTTVGNAHYNETESKMSLIHLLIFISLKYLLNIVELQLYFPMKLPNKHGGDILWWLKVWSL